MTMLKNFVAVVSLWMLVCLTASAGNVTYIYTDPQGTPLAEADANGSITATFDYKPYGSQALGSASGGPGYTGHVNDPDTSLVYMQARYYDALIGRFLSVDPVGTSPGSISYFNRFAYVGDNPVGRVDPFGKYFCEQDSGCADFDAAYAKVKEAAGAYSSHSAEGKAFSKVLSYYGAKGAKNDSGNAVYIKEGPTSMGNPAEIGHNVFTGSDTIKFDFSQFKNGGSPLVEMAASVAHEGQHGADDTERRKIHKRESDDTVLSTERNAYRLQSFVNQAFSVDSIYPGLWKGDWPANEVEWRREDAVNKYAQLSLEAWKSQH